MGQSLFYGFCWSLSLLKLKSGLCVPESSTLELTLVLEQRVCRCLVYIVVFLRRSETCADFQDKQPQVQIRNIISLNSISTEFSMKMCINLKLRIFSAQRVAKCGFTQCSHAVKFQSLKAKKGFIISKIVLNLPLHQPCVQTFLFLVSHLLLQRRTTWRQKRSL